MRVMSSALGRGRAVVAQGITLAGLLLAWCPFAFALNPALDVSQYAHTSWRIRDGFTKGQINAIAQTPDGYLWLATEFGLVRFDGVRTVAWEPPAGEMLPSNWVTSLSVAREGTLWIGTFKGLASWKNGKLTQYPQLSGMQIEALVEDRHGTVWVGGVDVLNGKLCSVESGTNAVQCYGEDGMLGSYVASVFEDTGGDLWAATASGLWRWAPGPPKRYAELADPNMATAFVEIDHHSFVVATPAGLRQLVEGKLEKYPVAGDQGSKSFRVLRDRDDGLWIGRYGAGLTHLHHGRMDVFVQANGLSSDYVDSVFEDREGNIWVATNGGLDRFRDFAVSTVTVSQGLPSEDVASVLPAADGLWLGTSRGLDRWNDGQFNHVPYVGAVRYLVQDVGRRLWIGTDRGVGFVESGRFEAIRGVPGEFIRGMTIDRDGDLWVAHRNLGLFRVHAGRGIESIPWSALGRKDFPSAVVADQMRRGLWLGFYQGGLAYFADGRIRMSYAASDGLGEGAVNGLHFDPGGTLWVATDGGLSRVKDKHVATLTTRNGLPCDAVHWMVDDDVHDVWLDTACGLVRFGRDELDAWAAASDERRTDDRTIHAVVFDASDGVRSRPAVGGSGPKVAKTSDGRLWFLLGDGVSVVDPQHLPFNRIPPPVHIEQIIADRKTHDVTAAADNQVRLPPLIRDLQVDYTALSFVAPEKMRFRYMLEGHDRDWQDVGTRRQAFYTDLSPGLYRFRVKASNNSGVWSEAGALLDFSVAPAYYQTVWFRVAVVAAFLLLLAALHQLRLRYVTRQFSLRMDERVHERTRIARDLHDTLLQSFHGVLLRFQAATNLLPDRPADARTTLERAIEQAAQAITEGRDAVQGLRDSTTVTNDLAEAITTLGQALRSDQPAQRVPAFQVDVEGSSRDLHPILRDEVFRVAGEALRNAFRHAQATRIEVEIRYDERYLRVRVRDDGKGIDPHLLEDGGRAGHYGLSGMYERGALIGGKLTVWSELESGTEVELTIPASVGYTKSHTVDRSVASSART